MTEREALKLALEVLVEMTPSGPNGSAIWHKQMSAITAASEALAQPDQEPVANYCKECLTYNGHHEGCSHYTTTPQRTWVGLTDEEIADIYAKPFEIVRMAEAKLKEKNT